ncbi:MAG: NAD(+)/NADH kinase [Nanobdellota archaeon]
MKALLVYMKLKKKAHKDSFEKVKRVLKENSVSFRAKRREYVSPEDIGESSIVITLGGDGTFLGAASRIKDTTPVLGVNMDPENKEGFLLSTDKEGFEDFFLKILSGKAKPVKLRRLKALVNGRELPRLALNEFYIGYQKAYHTARYELRIEGRKEFQKSSGLLISTPAGSHGWTASAGGKKMSLDSGDYQMIVRELYCSSLTSCTTYNKIFSSRQKLRIRSEMDRGIIVADSLQPEYKLYKGDMVEIRPSRHWLYVY